MRHALPLGSESDLLHDTINNALYFRSAAPKAPKPQNCRTPPQEHVDRQASAARMVGHHMRCMHAEWHGAEGKEAEGVGIDRLLMTGCQLTGADEPGLCE